MKLTLNQAATALGKTRRQLVYLIEQGRIPAEKVGGRWYLDSEALELDAATRQRDQRKQAGLQSAIEDALIPKDQRRRYSLRDLKAVQIAQPLLEKLREYPGGDHPSIVHLHTCLKHLAQGCHRYARADKAQAYQAARDAASLAALELILTADPRLDPLSDDLEQDLMPAIAGLLRRLDRSRDPAGPA